MRTIVFICGLHSIGFAIFHVFFWKIFNWKKDLASASISTRAIIQIANLRLIYIFFGVGALCFIYPDELLTTTLGRAFLMGMSLFWVGRTVEQFIFLPYNRVMIHVLNALFVLGAALFAIPVVTGQ